MASLLAVGVWPASLGCSDLPQLGVGVCGNGLIEEGEQCDLVAALGVHTTCGEPEDGARACRYLCDQDEDCPEGWGCGADGTCRFPSGTFSERQPALQLLHEDLRLIDIDGDGHLDAVGSTAGRVRARLGDGRAAFATLVERSLGFSGIPVFAEIDGDGACDAVGTGSGGVILARGQARDALAPVPLASLPLPAGFAGALLFPVSQTDSPFPALLALAKEREQEGGSFLLLPDTDEDEDVDPQAVTGPIGRRSPDEIAGRIPSAIIDGGDGEDKAMFVVAFEGEGRVHVFELTSDCSSGECVPQIDARQPVELDGQVGGGGASLLDADGDGQMELMVDVAGAAVSVFPLDAEGDSRKGFPLIERWPLAVGDLNGDLLADLVGPDGISVFHKDQNDEPGFEIAQPSPQQWTEAAIADFNRDGIPDVAAVSDHTDFVDVLLGTEAHLWNLFRARAGRSASHLRTADFDGDRVTDLAVITEPDDGDGGLVLKVLFGDVDGAPLSEPVEMARLDEVRSLEPLLASLPSSLDGAADLLVQRSLSEAATLMLGSTERALVSPFILNGEFSTDFQNPNAVLPGRFDPSGDLVNDLVVFTSEDVRLLAGQPEVTAFAPEAPIDYVRSEVASEALALLGGLGCTGAAMVADLGADGQDEILVTGGTTLESTGPDCRELPATLGVFSFTDDLAGVATAILDLAGQPDDIRIVRAAMLDGGPEPEVILASSHGIWVYWNDANGLDTQAASTASLDAEIRGIAVMNSDADPERELAIASDAGVVLVDLGPSRALVPSLEPSAALAGAWIESGDLDEDGLDDLLVSDGTTAHVLLAQPGELSGPAEVTP